MKSGKWSFIFFQSVGMAPVSKASRTLEKVWRALWAFMFLAKSSQNLLFSFQNVAAINNCWL